MRKELRNGGETKGEIVISVGLSCPVVRFGHDGGAVGQGSRVALL